MERIQCFYVEEIKKKTHIIDSLKKKPVKKVPIGNPIVIKMMFLSVPIWRFY